MATWTRGGEPVTDEEARWLDSQLDLEVSPAVYRVGTADDIRNENIKKGWFSEPTLRRNWLYFQAQERDIKKRELVDRTAYFWGITIATARNDVRAFMGDPDVYEDAAGYLRVRPAKSSRRPSSRS